MTDLLERPVVGPAADLPEDDITHYYCCDENRANCGLDISDEPFISGEPKRRCEACVEAIGMPCGDPLCPNLDGLIW